MFCINQEGLALLLNEDSSAGTNGDKDIYQNYFICLNYETRKVENKIIYGLFIQYGIQIDSEEIIHLYLNFFDNNPLDPTYYSFGSRNADVQILNARLENFDIEEQIKLRCSKQSSNLNKPFLQTNCDYKCHSACDGCYSSFSVFACKKCAYAQITFDRKLDSSRKFLCVEKCPEGYYPDLNNDKICTDINECLELNKSICQKNSECINTIGSYKCNCKEGYTQKGLICEG